MEFLKSGPNVTGTTSNAQQHQAAMLAFLGKSSAKEASTVRVQPVPVSSVREGWEEDYKLMHANGDDQFIMDEFFPEDIDRLSDLFGDNPISF